MSAIIPLESRARWAAVALVLVVLVDLATIAVDWLDIGLINRYSRGEFVSPSDLDASDDRQALIWVANVAMLIVSAVFFIRWFHAAYKNLRQLGQPYLRHGDGWAIGGWFVPVLSLWRPKELANDIWRATDPTAPPNITGEGWLRGRTSPLLLAWWIVWVVSSVGSNVIARVAFSGNSASNIRSADRWEIVGSLVDIAAALLAIAVVRALTRRESALIDRYGRAEDGTETAPAVAAG